MGAAGDQHRESKTKAMEELRCFSVGRLIHIIDELEGMDLSVREVETILRTCGLNVECAMRFGAEVKYEKENHYNLFDNSADGPTHP